MTLTDVQLSLRKEVLTQCRHFGYDYWLEHDRSATYPWEFVRASAERGWLGMMIPQAYGGAGLGVSDAAVLLHAVCESGAGLSGASAIHLNMFPLSPVVRHGTELLKADVLPRIANGELLCAFGITEPNAGSDTSRIETQAELAGGRWVINGQKVWTTNAQNAQKILLLARNTPRNEEHPLQGMTLFLTDLDRKACDVRRIDKLGRAAVDSNEVFIHDLVATPEQVIGDVGRGFGYLLDGLNPERILLSMEAAGIGRAALNLATEYARDRVVFGSAIGRYQAISHPLAAAWARLEAVELLALEAARLYDLGEPCAREANAAKYLAAEAGFDACDAALQTHGGFGYAKEYHVERLWREVRLMKIAPISQEMVLNYLARHPLGLPKSYGLG